MPKTKEVTPCLTLKEIGGERGVYNVDCNVIGHCGRKNGQICHYGGKISDSFVNSKSLPPCVTCYEGFEFKSSENGIIEYQAKKYKKLTEIKVKVPVDE
jgi:hypothetical protein